METRYYCVFGNAKKKKRLKTKKKTKKEICVLRDRRDTVRGTGTRRDDNNNNKRDILFPAVRFPEKTAISKISDQ